MTTGDLSGGVVFRVGEELFFLPAAVALKLLPVPEVARLPGAPEPLAGAALVEGEVIAVARVGEAVDVRATPAASRHEARPRAMLVCDYLGERLGLVGLEVLATGRFASHGPDEITFEGQSARRFDVGAIVARMREGGWGV